MTKSRTKLEALYGLLLSLGILVWFRWAIAQPPPEESHGSGLGGFVFAAIGVVLGVMSLIRLLLIWP